MAESSIEWTEMTWNPTTGCNKLSAGCKFCYAEVMSKRLKAMGVDKYKDGFKLAIHPDTLNAPYSWKKPKKVFVNSMSDLFHKDVPLNYIKQVFAVMNDNPKHTFQVLTKRADILAEYDRELTWSQNIWMGVSVENETVIDRIDFLRNTSAHIKFLSLEPLIGPLPNLNLRNIDWAIVGGESGHKARPIKQEWVIDIMQQCKSAGVHFFFKQWGKPKFNYNPNDPTIKADHPQHAKGGCRIRGRIYRDMPSTHLRVAAI
jgi:protein gp37